VRKKEPRRHVSPGLKGAGADRGEGGMGSLQLVCIDNARVVKRFPHKQERARDGRRCPY
jgi:hypothetical protein